MTRRLAGPVPLGQSSSASPKNGSHRSPDQIQSGGHRPALALKVSRRAAWCQGCRNPVHRHRRAARRVEYRCTSCTTALYARNGAFAASRLQVGARGAVSSATSFLALEPQPATADLNPHSSGRDCSQLSPDARGCALAPAVLAGRPPAAYRRKESRLLASTIPLPACRLNNAASWPASRN